MNHNSLWFNLYPDEKPLKLGVKKNLIFKIDSLQPNTSYKGYIEVTDSISKPSISAFSFDTKKFYAKHNRLYLINGDAPYGDMIKTSDGGYILAGGVIVRDHHELCICKLDSLGYEVWNYIFDDSFVGNFNSFSAIELSGNDYLFCSEKLITKFSQQGVVIWKHYLESEVMHDGIGFQGAIETSNNELLVLGMDKDANPFTMKLGSDGSLIWKKSGEVNFVKCITPLSNGNYAILSGIDRSYFLYIMNEEGNIIKSHGIGDGRFNSLQKVINTSEGGGFWCYQIVGILKTLVVLEL